MTTLKKLEQEILLIKKRNKKVEADKAWELSWTRRILVTMFTYIVVVLFFFVAELPKPFINSIVPSIAFLLSSFTLNLFKKQWIKNR